MKVNEAVPIKLKNICKERNISINKLAVLSCLTQRTIENIVYCNSKNPKLLTIVRICDELGITLKEFFSNDLFLNLDRED